MRKILAPLIAVLLALASVLPVQAVNQKSAQMAYKYVQNSAVLNYCVLLGQGSSPFGSPITGPSFIKTTGSSVTTNEATASSGPFSVVAVNDVIYAAVPATPVVPAVPRNVVTKASAAQITVDTVWDLGTTGVNFAYKNAVCGTGATAGFIDVSGLTAEMIYFRLDALAGTSVDLQIECKINVSGVQPVKAWPPIGSTDPTVCGSGTLTSGFCRYSTASTGPTVGIDLYAFPRDVACSNVRVGVATNGGAATYTLGLYEVLDTQN